MSSLEGCIKKAGPALRKEDADAIRKIRDDIYGAGDVSRDIANQSAVDEYLQILKEERVEILRQAEEKGGLLADRSLEPSEFAKQTAERLETLAREFPKLGMQRSSKKPLVDLMTMSLEDLHKVLNNFDPQLAGEMLEANGGMDKLTGMTGSDRAETQEIYVENILPFLAEAKKIQLRMKVEDSDPFLDKLAQVHPDTPMSVTHKFGKAMNIVADESAIPPTGLRGLLERLTGGKTSQMSKSGLLTLLPQSKLPTIIRNGMQSTKRYVQNIKKMSAYMERLMEGHADVGRTWLEFNRDHTDTAKILGELMHASSLAGVDMADFQTPTEADFKKMNKNKRKMWLQREADYKVLLPFWEKIGRTGNKITYEESIYQAGVMQPDGLRGDGRSRVLQTHTVPEGHAIYMQVRDTYRNMRRRGIEGLEERISAAENDQQVRKAKIAGLRKLFESGKIKPYFPLSRFGKYAAVAKDPETGEVVGFFKRENRSERNRLVENLRKMGHHAYPIDEIDSDAAMVNQIDPSFVTKVTELIGEEPAIDGKPGLSLQDEIWQMYLRSLPEMSVRKAFIHRTGRLGFSHDALRAFGDQTFHGTHQLAKLKFGYQLQDDLLNAKEEAEDLLKRASWLTELKDGMVPRGHKGQTPHQVMLNRIPEYQDLYDEAIAKDPTNENIVDELLNTFLKQAEHEGPWAIPLYEALAKRHEYNMNPKSAAWATNLTAMGFLWFLSSSPAAGVLNLSQTAISAYPILRARFAGAGAGMELLRASKQYATSGEMIAGSFGTKLRNDTITHADGSTSEAKDVGEKAAFEYFQEIGMFAKTRTRDLMGLAERGAHQNDKMAQAMEVAGWIFHKTEEANRMVTALASYRLARKKFDGKGTPLEQHESAVEMTDELVEKSHYDYTNTNRPQIMQGDKGRVVFLFRNYSVNMQYRLIRDFRDGIWKNENISKEDRVEARSRFAGIITMTSMFAGMSGWPLMAATQAILDMLLGDDDEPFDSRTEFRKVLQDTLGETVGDAVYKGPWDTFTGLSLSGRASLNNLWIREVPDSLRGKDLLMHLAGEGLGPVFGIGMNYAQGWQDIQDDNGWRGMEKLVPKFVADWSKTMRYMTQGAQTRQSDMIVPPEAFSSVELLGQFMGFTPSELVKQYEQNRAIKDMSMKLTNRRNQLVNRMFNAYKLGDRKVTRETVRDIVKWNKSNPRYPITVATLKRSAKSRAQYDMRTVGGIALDKRLQYLFQTMNFTDRGN